MTLTALALKSWQNNTSWPRTWDTQQKVEDLNAKVSGVLSAISKKKFYHYKETLAQILIQAAALSYDLGIDIETVVDEEMAKLEEK